MNIGVHVVVLRRCYDKLLASPGWFVLPLSPVRPMYYDTDLDTGSVTCLGRHQHPIIEEVCIEDKLLRPLPDESDTDHVDDSADIDLGDSSSHLAIGIAA